MRVFSASLLTLTLAASAMAQTRIDPARPYAWQENCGWVNFATFPATSGSGARITTTSLEGYLWSETIGWISLSSAAVNPTQNQIYANTSDQTYGVNISPTGELSGFAWCENAGWLNFSGGALASPPNPARLDSAAGRFYGYAWGEQIGWLNLDDPTTFVAVACPADFNLDGSAAIDDVFIYIAAWFLQDPRCDVDTVPGLSIDDLFVFISIWFRGC